MEQRRKPAIWFLAVRTGSGTEVFTERLVDGLRVHGVQAEITWLPHRAEFAPWSVCVPQPPAWATVVHVNTWIHARFLPKNIPVVATLHHAMHEPELKQYKGWMRSIYHKYWFAPTERRTMIEADKLVAVSMFAAECARRSLPDRQIHIIYNGVDVVKFRPPPQRNFHRPMRLLYIGKWARLKGVDLLRPIMQVLGDGFELRYTGGTAARGDRTTMPTNMIDLGRLQGEASVVAAMQDADVLIFPSRSEGFGLVAAEAMGCGLPVIATGGSSLQELVVDGVTGILCPQDDIQAFVAALRALESNKPRWSDMSLAARRHVLTSLDQNLMVEAYLHLYVECLNIFELKRMAA